MHDQRKHVFLALIFEATESFREIFSRPPVLGVIEDMSIIFSYGCPRCGRPTEISIASTCLNTLNDGRICGYTLPEVFGDFNSKVRAKIEKHTEEPTGLVSGQISYNPSTGFYLQNLKDARASGNVYLDIANGYFFTYVTPSGTEAIATISSPGASNSIDVSGFKMPLNSRLHNLHGHYDNLNSGNLFVAVPNDVVVEAPDGTHPDEYRIVQSGTTIAAWNTTVQSGFIGSHVVIQ